MTINTTSARTPVGTMRGHKQLL